MIIATLKLVRYTPNSRCAQTMYTICMDTSYSFPKNFTWGVSTSAYQTEGNNTNTDWYVWEKSKKPHNHYPNDVCGVACDSYNRYEEDLDLCVRLGVGAYRFSIEWARIEPVEGVFDQKEIEHYRQVMLSAKKRGLKTFVTLHHFTNPIWFAKKGGFLNLKSAFYFARYSKVCAEKFGDLIDVFLTINEPQVYALMGYTLGIWPPNVHNYFASLLVQINLMRSHRAAYDAIKKVNKSYLVGIVKQLVWYKPVDGATYYINKLTANVLHFLNCEFFLAPIRSKLDLIGVNHYFSIRVKNFKQYRLHERDSDLEWGIHPEGLENVLLDLRHYNLPIYVTENGLADVSDKKRIAFLDDMLAACSRALNSGVDLRGFFYWSLIDNFEWHHGFWPRFGLVEIDYENNLQRKPRPSFSHYAEICKSGRILV